MKTELVKVDASNPDPSIISRAAACIRTGGLVVFPTETVYGLGASGLDETAVRRIYKAKGRPDDNPLILHIASTSDLARLVSHIPAVAERLIARYWPGPLTLVLRRSAIVPDVVTGGLGTVAVRLPASPVACALIAAAGVPIAAPSANRSGRPSPTSAQAVFEELDGRVAMILDGGPCAIGVESTVLDCTSEIPMILRPGGVTYEMLLETLGEVAVDQSINAPDLLPPRSPGMKYRHYAPAAPMIVFEPDECGEYLNRLVGDAAATLETGKKVGAVVSSETSERLPAGVQVAVFGSRTRPQEVARGLYRCLRQFDAAPVDIIFAEGIADRGLGRAIMNRMRKAAGSTREE